MSILNEANNLIAVYWANIMFNLGFRNATDTTDLQWVY